MQELSIYKVINNDTELLTIVSEMREIVPALQIFANYNASQGEPSCDGKKFEVIETSIFDPVTSFFSSAKNLRGSRYANKVDEFLIEACKKIKSVSDSQLYLFKEEDLKSMLNELNAEFENIFPNKTPFKNIEKAPKEFIKYFGDLEDSLHGLTVSFSEVKLEYDRMMYMIRNTLRYKRTSNDEINGFIKNCQKLINKNSTKLSGKNDSLQNRPLPRIDELGKELALHMIKIYDGEFDFDEELENNFLGLIGRIELNEDIIDDDLKWIISAIKDVTVFGCLEKHFGMNENFENIYKKTINTINYLKENQKKYTDSNAIKVPRNHSWEDEKDRYAAFIKNDPVNVLKEAYIAFKKHDDIEPIGEGNASLSVTKAYDLKKNRMLVMKTVGPHMSRRIWESVKKNFPNEIAGFAHTRNNENFVQMIASFSYLSKHSQTEEKRAIFMELIEGGTLNPKKLREGSQQIRHSLTKDLLKGLDYLHRKNIALLDIKPDNIMLHRSGSSQVAKFIDFGTFREKTDVNEFIGTPMYMPPEMFGRHLSKNVDAKKRDVWAIGLVLYQLYIDDIDFSKCISHKQTLLLADEIIQKLKIFESESEEEGEEIEVNIENLILKMLKEDPKNRISGAEAFEIFKKIDDEILFFA